jgi:hypothetical protein
VMIVAASQRGTNLLITDKDSDFLRARPYDLTLA